MTAQDDYRYSETHQWAAIEPTGLVAVGITDHAQQQLGDVLFVELPRPGSRVTVQQVCATVESVKSASDVYSPLAGVVVETNSELVDHPESLNSAPYSSWLFRLRADDSAEMQKLLTFAEYHKIIE